MTPGQTIADQPAFAQPAPKSPPTSACDEEDGMPRNQVIRFHRIAPISAPKITCGSTTDAEMMPTPSVSATCRPKNKNAMKLKNAAHATAYCGFSTRVETMVAIEFAASCSPFRKSKISATMMSPTRNGRPIATASMRAFPRASNVIDHDALDFVGDVVETVDAFLQVIVDFVPDEKRDRIAVLLLEQILQPAVVDVVGLAFELGDLLGDRR